MQAINKIILGTVQMGIDYGINNPNGKIPLEEGEVLLNEAYHAGIRYLDTAEAYGDAHQVIGNYHRRKDRSRFNILTKLPHQLDIKTIKHKCESYINELGVDYLWGLSFHSYQSYYQYFNDTVEDLADLKNRGVINKIGVSVYTNEEFENVIENGHIEIIQIPYNVFDNMNTRGELLKTARSKGKEIHARSCFLQGLFFKDIMSDEPVVKKLKDELVFLDEICLKYNISKETLALNYVCQNPLIDKVLIGIDNRDQLDKNVRFMNDLLSQEIIQDVEKIKIKNNDILNPSLWSKLM